ncbi:MULTISPECIES: carbon starvation CstA family protein [Halomonadaceae]|jgi:carbon starvation protein CstA|uniref:Carbon starvation protein CstA n=1 Tax=Vreelandella aquamarina TaxID=77097 RepID=A0A1H8H344_9GAMM|nr:MULTISPECIES: carbon starvation protein A [Halomonas]MCO7242280.1 carbon starvation protein A [Halomonas sp. Ps84H-12]MEC9304904.1 carbon starvation protein A [Pseudomonadota bacterium]SEN50663.1 Carbon starvation protein CstA [Halomonas aquamarina]HBS18371.1 carbon starvation protein A [Halomonas sp.]
MITFIFSIVLLVVGYFTYGKFVERVFVADRKRQTPAFSMRDDIDYVPMNTTRNSLIQLLNIAGVGPIFGPILGALYGPVAFVWIVIGCIFAGAVHDYLTGMISIRNHGAHLPQLAGKFLGKTMKHVVNGFAILLLLLVGTVFVTSPAALLANMTSLSLTLIILAIFAYYLIATLLPIDKVIGRIYPYFGALLLFSAAGIGIGLVVTGAPIPELSFQNMHPDNAPIFPLLFLTISCGALSGFHATQTPIISRTTENETNGRKIFYGMMIAEGVIAMIWAAAAMSLFQGEQSLSDVLAAGGPAAVVGEVSTTMLGAVGGTLAVLGVIVLPITSGDTAFRSARMIIADYLKVEQKPIVKRILIALPLFVASYALTHMDFTLLWRYFSWANQTTAVIALWTGTMYLVLSRKPYLITSIPAVFMTMATFTYLAYAPIGFNLPLQTSYIVAALGTLVCIALFMKRVRRLSRATFSVDEPVPGALDQDATLATSSR